MTLHVPQCQYLSVIILFLWCVLFQTDGEGNVKRLAIGLFFRSHLFWNWILFLQKISSIPPPITITGICILSIYRPIKGNYRIHCCRVNLGTIIAWELSNQPFHSDWSCRFNNAKEGWAQSLYEFINCVYCIYCLPVSLRHGIIKYEWQYLNYRVVPAYSSSEKNLLEHNYWVLSSF